MYYSLRTRNAGIYYRWRKKYFYDRYSVFNLFTNAYITETLDPAKSAALEDLDIRNLFPFLSTAPDKFYAYALGDGEDRVRNINSITGDTYSLEEKESFREVNLAGPSRFTLTGEVPRIISSPESIDNSADLEVIEVRTVLDNVVNTYLFDAETAGNSFVEVNGHPVNNFEREEDRMTERFSPFLGFNLRSKIPFRDLCTKKFESFDDATIAFEYAPGQYRMFKERRFNFTNTRFSFRDLYWYFSRTFNSTTELCDLQNNLEWPLPGMEFNGIRYTSTFDYPLDYWIRLEFEDTATAGSETVLVTPAVTVPPENGLNYVVTIGIEAGVSTNSEIIAALEADSEFTAILTAELTNDEVGSDTHPAYTTPDPTTRDEIQETDLVLHHGINCVALSSFVGQSNDEKNPQLDIEHVIYFDKFYIHGIVLDQHIYLVDINGNIFKTDALIGFPDNDFFIDRLRRIQPSVISYDYQLYYDKTYKDMTYKISFLNRLDSGTLKSFQVNVVRDAPVGGETHYGLSILDGIVDFNTDIKNENIFENELFFIPTMDNDTELIETEMKFTEGTEQCLPLLHFRDKRVPSEIEHNIPDIIGLSFDNSGKMYVYDGTEYSSVNYHYDSYVLNEPENSISFTDTYASIVIDI